MSAYAALVSLRQTLETVLDRGGPRILRIRAQLRSLREKVMFLMDFLEKSSPSTRQPALEAKMREAACTAENLVEKFWITGNPDSVLRNLAKMTFRYLVYAVVVYLVQHNRAAVAICTIYAVVMHIAFQIDDGLKAQKSQELPRVLYDFSVIERDVIRIEEARGEQEMLGYAALIALRQTLDSALDDSGGMRISHNRAQLESLHEKVLCWLDFLGNASTSAVPLQDLDAEMREAAIDAKTLIEPQISIPGAQFILDSYRRKFYVLMEVSLFASLSYLPAFAMVSIIMLAFINYELIFAISLHVNVIRVCTMLLVGWFDAIALGFSAHVLGTGSAEVVFLVMATTNNYNSEMQVNQELSLVIDTLSYIMSQAIQIHEGAGLPAAASSRRDLGGNGNDNVVVGLESEIKHIKALLLEESSQLQVISIVGMGGIGKTTLASQVYNDPDFAHHFDVRGWVKVSHKYSLSHVLLRLLDSLNKPTNDMQKDSQERLGDHLYHHLFGRRFLIVMDDVWDREIWDTMRIFFPDDGKKSRVLLTSRSSNVASHLMDSRRYFHQMQCRKEEESWNLLRGKVFGAQGCCPEELESIGREIARSCRGLPLVIVVIAGVLSNDNRIEIWSEVAEKLRNSKMKKIRKQCLEILGLSYNHLPHHLRPCFLYMAVSSGGSEIPVSKLISLWAAEGFLKPCTTKSLDEVAEEYLKDLIDRNLILVCKRSCNGKIRTCSIHDLSRDVCVQNARKENFLHVVNFDGSITLEMPDKTPRRLSMPPDTREVKDKHDLSHVRSFLCSSKLLNYPSVGFIDFPHLRVLDVLVVHFEAFPDQVIELVSLRYLAFSYDGPLPPSMSKLQYLETLIHHHRSFHKYPLLPPVIWNMLSLRHLYVKPGCYLSDPGYRLPWNSSALEHLQTLMGIRNLRWSRGIIKRIPNLKKLSISYDAPPSKDWSEYQLKSIVNLHQLEILKIKCEGSGSANLSKIAFPQKLKKLSLSGSGIPWASIGALPNLEALKLRSEACCGPSWETVEGDFPQLIFLLLEELSFRCWETDATHFPRLQRLVIRSCGMLEEIPYAIADIPTLEIIELDDCHPAAVASAEKIQEEQESMGNDDLKVRIRSPK